MTHATKTLIALSIVILGSGTSFAATIHVPSEQPTIQQGIDAASGGDTVFVAVDVYTGPMNRDLNFGGKDIVLESEPLTRAIIDCEYAGRGFLFESGEDTTAAVRSISVLHAVADTGAGAYCRNGSSPKFEDCVFSLCEARNMGGGICCDASSPIVRDCQLWGTEADDTAREDGHGGGIACISGASPLIVDTSFDYNHALQSGGGLYSRQSSPTLVNCVFFYDTLGDYGQGAAVKIHQSTGPSFTGCVFHTCGVPTCVGGGIHASSSTFDAIDCRFINNKSGAAGGLHLTDGSMANISGCEFVDNVGSWSAAGGMQCVLGSDATVSNCTFVANGMYHVWCDGTSPTLEYCVLAFSASGLPVYCETGAETPHIHHCFVYGNEGGDTLCGGNTHDIEYADPILCGFPSRDVALCADSPCLPGATWPQLVGARGQGCGACGSVVERRSWGSIKAEYR